jgi:hypothetical protein
MKNPVLPHGASSIEKAILAIHPLPSGWGILAFSRKKTDTVVKVSLIGPAPVKSQDAALSRASPFRRAGRNGGPTTSVGRVVLNTVSLQVILAFSREARHSDILTSGDCKP